MSVTKTTQVQPRLFNTENLNWVKSIEYNFIFLRAQESYFNDLLKAKGVVFLNEVYRGLGMPETRAGQFLGWRLDRGLIDFDIQRLATDELRIYFDVHGDVIDQLPEEA